MYNAFIVRKRTLQAIQIKKKYQSNRRYIDRYYNKTRPILLQNYNKRINSFIRKMQQQPIKITIDPCIKSKQQIQQQHYHVLKLTKHQRSFSSMSRKKSYTDKNQFIHHYSIAPVFKYKNNQDWKSLLTPFQRIQRKKNHQLFEKKYGDPSIAYRSIGSQSEYKPGHQFRERDKQLEINPPMRYTNQPTKQILAKLKNRLKNKTAQKTQTTDSNIHNSGQLKQDDILARRNITSSSLSIMNQDVLLSQNDKISRYERESHSTQKQIDNVIQGGKYQKKEKEVKLHFKQIMDMEQNIDDVKTKKALREILYRCGVYRRKNKRTVSDSEVDQLSEFTDIRDR